MPVQIVTPTGISAPRYAVIGVYASPPAYSENCTGFVTHLAILRLAGTVRYGQPADVWEMMPPLIASEASLQALQARDADHRYTSVSHIVGWLHLTPSQMDGITHWISEMATYHDQQNPNPYRAYTASLQTEHEWRLDEQDRRLYPRFSCTSFVLRAYRDGAGIPLLRRDCLTQLPVVELPFLIQAYPLAQDERVRNWINLPPQPDGGGWRVALPGYLFHAIAAINDPQDWTGYCVQTVSEANYT